MKALLLGILGFLTTAPLVAQPIERRCGWLDNPTPGNWFLTDGAGSWEIGLQGGFRARGLETIAINNEKEYVRTNGNYGYACACMDVTTQRSAAQWRITSLRNFKQQSLKQCLEDPSLPKAR